MPGDSRKDFVLVTTANYFAIPITDNAITALFNALSLNNFLDDGNVSILAGKLDPKNDKKIEFQNRVSVKVSICQINLPSNLECIQELCFFLRLS